MSVTVTYKSELTVIEALSAGVAAASDKSVTHSVFNTTATKTAVSTPPVTQVAAFDQALVGGAATIDLTNLSGTNLAAVVGTGLRIQFLKLKAATANANPITISKGASNGYNGFGANFNLELAPGGEALLFANDAGGDVAAGNKTLDLAGTGTQVMECEFVLG